MISYFSKNIIFIKIQVKSKFQKYTHFDTVTD